MEFFSSNVVFERYCNSKEKRRKYIGCRWSRRSRRPGWMGSENDQASEQNKCTDDISSPPLTSFAPTQNKNKRMKKQRTGNNFEQQLIDIEKKN